MQDRLCVRSELARQDSRLSKPWLVCTRLSNARGLAFPPQQTAYAITDKYSIPRCYKVSVPSWIMFPQRSVLPLQPGIHKSAVAVKRMFGKHQLPSRPKRLVTKSILGGYILPEKSTHINLEFMGHCFFWRLCILSSFSNYFLLGQLSKPCIFIKRIMSSAHNGDDGQCRKWGFASLLPTERNIFRLSFGQPLEHL